MLDKESRLCYIIIKEREKQQTLERRKIMEYTEEMLEGIATLEEFMEFYGVSREEMEEA